MTRLAYDTEMADVADARGGSVPERAGATVADDANAIKVAAIAATRGLILSRTYPNRLDRVNSSGFYLERFQSSGSSRRRQKITPGFALATSVSRGSTVIVP